MSRRGSTTRTATPCRRWCCRSQPYFVSSAIQKLRSRIPSGERSGRRAAGQQVHRIISISRAPRATLQRRRERYVAGHRTINQLPPVDGHWREHTRQAHARDDGLEQVSGAVPVHRCAGQQIRGCHHQRSLQVFEDQHRQGLAQQSPQRVEAQRPAATPERLPICHPTTSARPTRCHHRASSSGGMPAAMHAPFRAPTELPTTISNERPSSVIAR